MKIWRKAPVIIVPPQKAVIEIQQWQLISLSFLVEVYAYDKLMDKLTCEKKLHFLYVLIKVSLAVTFGSKISDFQIALI